MSIIETDTLYMKRDVGNISTYTSELETAANEIAGILNSLPSYWEGDSATVYESSLNSDLGRLREMIRLLKDMNQGTGSAREKYEKCENSVAELISAITV